MIPPFSFASLLGGNVSSLTTTGTSGPATLSAGVLNIPQYSSAIASGTSNPGSPSAHQLFYRTDKDLLVEYDSGSGKWLTVAEYCGPMNPSDSLQPTSTSGASAVHPVRADFQLYLTRLLFTCFINSPNNGSNYYTFGLNWQSTAGIDNSIISNWSTSADSSGPWVNHDQVINAVLSSSAKMVYVAIKSKTGAPGNVYFPCAICYRLIVP